MKKWAWNGATMRGPMSIMFSGGATDALIIEHNGRREVINVGTLSHVERRVLSRSNVILGGVIMLCFGLATLPLFIGIVPLVFGIVVLAKARDGMTTVSFKGLGGRKQRVVVLRHDEELLALADAVEATVMTG